MNNTIISERILKMIDYMGVSINAFAKKIGYDRSQALYDIINNKAKPSYDFFNRFVNSEYSETINITWLISGKGKMLKEYNPIQIIDCPVESSISDPIQEGYSPYFNNLDLSTQQLDLRKMIEKKKPDSWIKIPGIEADVWFPVKGCNMEPKIYAGDTIGIKQIKRDQQTDPDKIYLVVTKNDYMIKHLETDNNNINIWWAVSENYRRFDIKKEDVVGIFQIVWTGRVL